MRDITSFEHSENNITNDVYTSSMIFGACDHMLAVKYILIKKQNKSINPV